MTANKMTGDFSDKPKTKALADRIIHLIEKQGPCKQATKGQTTFAVKRKFCWMWTYGKTADGTLFVTVLLDRELKNSHFQYVKQVSTNRWNHHVVVKSDDQIKSAWFKDLIEAGYAFSAK